MISTKHSNRGPRDAKSSSPIEQHSRDAAIKAKAQALDNKRAQLNEEIDKAAKSYGKATAEKHSSPSLGRTKASTNKCQQHPTCIDVDVPRRHVEEQSPARSRTYAISGKNEFRKAFRIDEVQASEQEE